MLNPKKLSHCRQTRPLLSFEYNEATLAWLMNQGVRWAGPAAARVVDFLKACDIHIEKYGEQITFECPSCYKKTAGISPKNSDPPGVMIACPACDWKGQEMLDWFSETAKAERLPAPALNDSESLLTPDEKQKCEQLREDARCQQEKQKREQLLLNIKGNAKRHKGLASAINSLRLSPSHRNQLKERGFTKAEVKNIVARSIIDADEAYDAGGAAQEKYGDNELKLVPGMDIDDDGYAFWKLYSGAPVMVLPSRSLDGRLTGGQIQTTDPRAKYKVLSSKFAKGPSTIHFPIVTADRIEKHDTGDDEPLPILIVEGILKAEMAGSRTEYPAIGALGIGRFAAAIDVAIEAGATEVVFGVDVDYLCNPNVLVRFAEAVQYCEENKIKWSQLVWWTDEEALDIIDAKHQKDKAAKILGELGIPKGIDDIFKPGVDGNRFVPRQVTPAESLDWLSQAFECAGKPNPLAMRQHTVASGWDLTDPKETAERPKIQSAAGKLDQVVRSVCTALGKTGRVFVGPTGELVEPAHSGELRPIARDSMPVRINETVCLQTQDKSGNWKDVDCGVTLGRQVHADGRWESVPRISAVSQNPTITAEGRVIQTQGLDEETGIYVAKVPDGWETLPDTITKEQALSSVRSLLDVVSEYEFSRGDEGRSGWLALVLTAIARPAIAGPTPMFVAEAKHPGAGKTMLLDLASIIATGHSITTMTLRGSDENDKIFLSAARAGQTWVAFDNLKQGCVIADRVLAWALTSPSIGGRLLGQSCVASAPNRLMFCCTGNQVSFSTEIARRSILIEIEHQGRDKQWERQNPRAWVRDQRSNLLRHGLTVLRYGLLQPPVHRQPMASFEAWSLMVRDTIIALDQPDPVKLMHAAQSKDAELESDHELIDALVLLIHDAQNSNAAAPGDPRKRAVGAQLIGQRAELAMKNFASQRNPGPLDARLHMAALTLQGRLTKGQSFGHAAMIGRKITEMVNREVDGRMIIKRGRHSQYRVENAAGKPV